MSRQKEQAEVLRLGLLAGVRTVGDAVAWADSVIAADPSPDIAVIEVASSSRSERYLESATALALFDVRWRTCESRWPTIGPVSATWRTILSDMRGGMRSNAPLEPT